MPTLKVAHLYEQGNNMIIAPLDHSFGYKSDSDQSDIIDEIQRAASSAGLAGTVVPVWESGGSFHFIAPRPWHPFFSSIGMRFVWANVNKTLSW